jgi:hypothetical protein
VTAAGRCAAQTRKEAASPPLMSGKKAAAPGLGDAPRKDTGPPLSVKAGCDPGQPRTVKLPGARTRKARP